MSVEVAFPTTATVVHDYDGADDDEVLSARKGQKLLVLEDYGDGWCDCELDEMAGIFPTAYLDFRNTPKSRPSSLRDSNSANSENDESKKLLAAAASLRLNSNVKEGGSNSPAIAKKQSAGEYPSTGKTMQQESLKQPVHQRVEREVSEQLYQDMCQKADSLSSQVSLQVQEIAGLKKQLEETQRLLGEARNETQEMRDTVQATSKDMTSREEKLQRALHEERLDMQKSVEELERTHIQAMQQLMQRHTNEAEKMRKRIIELEGKLLRVGSQREEHFRQQRQVSELELMAAKAASEASESQKMLEDVLQNFDTERTAFQTAQERLTAMFTEKVRRATDDATRERNGRVQMEQRCNALASKLSEEQSVNKQLRSQLGATKQELDKCKEMFQNVASENQQRKRAMEVQEKALAMLPRARVPPTVPPPPIPRAIDTTTYHTPHFTQQQETIHQSNQASAPPPGMLGHRFMKRPPAPTAATSPSFRTTPSRVPPPTPPTQGAILSPQNIQGNQALPLAAQTAPLHPEQVAYWQKHFYDQANDPFAGLQ